mmetsp:Transcript_84633/g.149896  ORF Transcript_84633/g.149896 Transcript_84633/m.149896 type:complete len:120 (-) Transcript_84633:1050-1409(-)
MQCSRRLLRNVPPGPEEAHNLFAEPTRNSASESDWVDTACTFHHERGRQYQPRCICPCATPTGDGARLGAIDSEVGPPNTFAAAAATAGPGPFAKLGTGPKAYGSAAPKLPAVSVLEKC